MSFSRHPKDIVLVDLCSWDGHHRTYFLKVMGVLLELGFNVSALCLNTEDCRNGSKSNAAKFLAVPPSPKLLIKAISICNRITHRCTGKLGVISEYAVSNLWSTRKAMRSGGVPSNAIVFFLHLDSMLVVKPTWLGKLLMPKRWAGLYFLPASRTPKNDPAFGTRRAAEGAFTSPRCKGIYLLDEGVIGDLKKYVSHGFVECLPEPIDLTCEGEVPLPVPFARTGRNDRSIVGMYGGLDKRKNVLNLVRAISRLNSQGIELVLKGRLDLTGYSDSEKNEFWQTVRDSKNISAEFVEEPLREPEFNRLIAASDIIFLAYRDFVGSSNILVKAASYSKPVIASRGFVIGERVEGYRLGKTVDQDDVEAMIKTIWDLSKGLQFNEELRKAFLDQNCSDLLARKLSLLDAK